MELVNLTPRALVFYLGDDDESTIVLPPSGTVARVPSYYTVSEALGGIPVVSTRFGEPILPEQRDGVAYVASTMVARAAAAHGRRDVYAPDTGPGSAVFDTTAEGRRHRGVLLGVRRLQRFF